MKALSIEVTWDELTALIEGGGSGNKARMIRTCMARNALRVLDAERALAVLKEISEGRQPMLVPVRR